MIQEKIKTLIQEALKDFGVPDGMVKINIDHPSEPKFGDYSTNVAMALAKSMGATTKNPLDLAKKLQEKLEALKDSDIEKVDVAAPGFINFHLSKKFFIEITEEILEKNVWYGKGNKHWNKRTIIEYSNLNPFKPFHIGHIVNNTIGETLARILEFQDVKLTRATYGGDVGLHVAKAMWGIMKLKDEMPKEGPLSKQIEFLGKAYATGSQAFDEDMKVAQDITLLNQKIYEKSDEDLNELYQWGRRVSLEHFQEIYKKLGSKFDYYILESEVAEAGKQIVMSYLDKGVFEKSDNAIIFPGEKHGLHNRVFINSMGWPTYEAKELGLVKKKFEIHNFDQSITITANEQNDYFKVVKKTVEQIYPEIVNRMIHVGHGMMRLSSGKMSSRKGNIITGDSLFIDTEHELQGKVKDKEFTEKEKTEIVEKIAVAAIKYSILKQSIGKDIIFDQEKSLSFDGDSGPYLQYTYVRSKSVLKKAEKEGIKAKAKPSKDMPIVHLEKLLYRFPEIVERAATDFAPNYIATYLIEVAGEYNKYYAKNKIVNTKDEDSGYKVALTEAVGYVIKNGLWLLGIDVPEKM